MQGNVLGQSGEASVSGLNVFAQLAEPRKKDGVWIKTEETVAQEKGCTTQLKELPYNAYGAQMVSIGNNIYLFGSSMTGTTKQAYKYDIKKDIYTKLTDLPVEFYNGSIAAVGNTIYLFGGSQSTDDSQYTYKKVYKYEISTNTYTELADMPYEFYSGRVVAIGTNIYLFGNKEDINGNNKNAYKYDTLTNTYTKLTNIPYNFENGIATAVENDIYLFSSFSSGNATKAYKYNTLTDTYTKLTDIPTSYILLDGR